MVKLHSAVLLLLVATLASTTYATQLHYVTDAVVPATPNATVSYWFACAKGALQGFEIGMYKKTNYVVNSTCLGKETVNDTMELYNLYFNNDTSKDIWRMLQIIQKIAHKQRKYCEFDDVLNDIFKWCDNNDCSIDYMLQNVLKKVIQITTVATNISNILNDGVVQPPISNATYYQTRWQSLATAAGQFGRYLTDFDANKLANY